MRTIISDRSHAKRDFDIEASFLVNKLCNFHCRYCFNRDDREHPGVAGLDVDRIADFIDGTGLRWHLHLSGGEPFVRPGFVELCERLSRRHLLSLNTNLVSRRVGQFAERVAAASIDVINAAVHMVEREQRRKVDQFIENFRTLQTAGFTMRALYVMAPECFSRYEDDRRRFADHGIHLEPKCLSARLDGRSYPRDYTPTQRELFERWSLESEEILAGTPRPRFDHMIGGHQQFERNALEGQPDFRGRRCAAGRLFVAITEDGTIWRCAPHGQALGSIRTGRLALLTEDMPCAAEFCPYYCFAYSSATAPGSEVTLRFPSLAPIKLMKQLIPLHVKNDIRRLTGRLGLARG